jgi:tetratricopeptide (TPR) repeat protein
VGKGVVIVLLPALAALTWPQTASAQHDHHRPPPAARVPVRMATSCRGTVAEMFDRGVAQLHAAAFAGAIDTFRLVAHSDVDCAMAWWGTALAHWGQWWLDGDGAAPAAGRRALERGAAARHASPRERAYLGAVQRLFEPGAFPADGLRRYVDAMTALQQSNPGDAEAALFAAAALLDRRELGAGGHAADRARALALIAGTPHGHDHPGVAHYTLRAGIGVPADARALAAAERLDQTGAATAAMRLAAARAWAGAGRWTEAVEASRRAADAARHDGHDALELLALDVEVLAQLQLGQDDEAARISRRIVGRQPAAGSGRRSIEARRAQALAPARLTLERGDWHAAATLAAAPETDPPNRQLVRLVAAVGAARTGDVAAARRALALADDAPPGDMHLSAITRLRRHVGAWIAVAEHRYEDAVRALEDAAPGDEDAASADTLATLLMTDEARGELLAAAGRHDAALEAFARALAAAPHRLRTLALSARAAVAAGRGDLAMQYYRAIERQTAGAPASRPEIAEARAWTAGLH